MAIANLMKIVTTAKIVLMVTVLMKTEEIHTANVNLTKTAKVRANAVLI